MSITHVIVMETKKLIGMKFLAQSKRNYNGLPGIPLEVFKQLTRIVHCPVADLTHTIVCLLGSLRHV